MDQGAEAVALAPTALRTAVAIPVTSHTDHVRRIVRHDAADVGVRSHVVMGQHLDVSVPPLHTVVVDGHVAEDHLAIAHVVEIVRRLAHRVGYLLHVFGRGVPLDGNEKVEVNQRQVRVQQQRLLARHGHGVAGNRAGGVHLQAGERGAIGPGAARCGGLFSQRLERHQLVADR